MKSLMQSVRRLVGAEPAGSTAPAEFSAPEAPAPAELAAILAQVPKLKQEGRHAEAIDLLASTFERVQHPLVGYRLIASMLDRGQLERIVQHPQARRFNTRDFALAEHLLQAGSTSPPLATGPDTPAIPDAALLMMVKDEEDILFENLVWHYALGLRRFFLIDNLSSDRTPALIQAFSDRFPDATVMVLRDPVQAYLQSRKTTAAARFSMTLWDDIRWWFPVDADEFICTTEPLAGLLAAQDPQTDAIIMPKSIYRMRSADDDAALPFHQRMTLRTPLGYQSCKIIARVHPEVVIGPGNHRLADLENRHQYRYVSPPGLTMREYPVRSFAQYLRKTINGGRAVESARQLGQSVGGDHWVRLYGIYQAKGEAGLRQALTRELSPAPGRPALIDDALPLTAVLDRLVPDWASLRSAAGRA